MKNKLIYIITILSILFSTCKKDKVKIVDVSIKNEEVFTGTNSVLISFNYTYLTALKNVVGYISQNSDMSNAASVNAEMYDKLVYIRFYNFAENTQYYYYYEYNNGVDVIKTTVKSFTTDVYGLPTVTTLYVSNVTATSATCGGNVTDDCGSSVTARGVCWSTSQNPTISDSHTTDGAGTGRFTSIITGLNSCTTYYFRAYATNSKGTNYGEQNMFYTDNPTKSSTNNGDSTSFNDWRKIQ